MAKVKSLRRKVSMNPQCQVASIDLSSYGEHYLKRRFERFDLRGWDRGLCGKSSSYCIDGVNMCTQHASQEALRLMLMGGSDD